MHDGERLNAIWNRTVEKMKEVVHEFKITQDELHLAGDYFNRLGQSGMCRSLFDVALAMTSIDAAGPAKGGTRTNLEGPYHSKHPPRPNGILFDHEPGKNIPRLTLYGTVTDADTGKPVPGAELDFWQADNDGIYDRTGSHLRGIVTADGEGRYRINTVVPSDYAEHDHDPIGELFRAMGKPNTRAAHIHLKVNVAGRELLTTQMFMPNSEFLDKDYVEGAVSDDLILDLKPDDEKKDGSAFKARFDVRLVDVHGGTAR